LPPSESTGDKASNLRALAEELNIGVDSFVFIDDNPVERSWVRRLRRCWFPSGLLIPIEYRTALLELATREFPSSITAEDRKRGEQYQAQAARSS
jgi:predicted enzyme involved in methoxymalonyl-ACP biosynthesis